MEFLNAMGAVHYWGYTPGVNFLKSSGGIKEGEEVNALLSGTSDIRHILRTIAGICKKETIESSVINVKKGTNGG